MNTPTSTSLPLYVQISELLHREIAAGHWQTGERLPVESKLADMLGVAVGTLRKALAILEEDGLLERRQGSGTYVRKPPDGGSVYHFFGLELRDGGGIPSADILSLERMPDQQVSQALTHKDNLPDHWRIRRLRYLNQQKVAGEEIWINGRHSESLNADRMHESLYVHYRERFGFWISRVTDELSCEPAPDWVTDALDLPAGSVCGLAERRSWSQHDEIEEVSRTWFDPAHCRYMARLS